MRRLEDSPLAVMRVCVDGVIRSANSSTYSALTLAPDKLIGRSLFSQFKEADPPPKNHPNPRTTKRCFDNCLKRSQRVKLDVALGKYTNHEREAAPMLLISDLAPDGRALGVLAVIELTLEDRVREQIARIARDVSIRSWEERLRWILRQIKRLIPFDHATFGMYAERAKYFRAFALYSCDGDDPTADVVKAREDFDWVERWLPLPEGIAEYLSKGRASIPDILSFVREYPGFADNEVVRMYQRQGMISATSLIAKDSKGPSSALSLCSRSRIYSEVEGEVLRNLDLEPVLIRIEDEIERQRHDLGVALAKQLAQAKELPAVTCEIVEKKARAELRAGLRLAVSGRPAGGSIQALLSEQGREQAVSYPPRLCAAIFDWDARQSLPPAQNGRDQRDRQSEVLAVRICQSRTHGRAFRDHHSIVSLWPNPLDAARRDARGARIPRRRFRFVDRADRFAATRYRSARDGRDQQSRHERDPPGRRSGRHGRHHSVDQQGGPPAARRSWRAAAEKFPERLHGRTGRVRAGSVQRARSD
ncbi:hypothetical protein [Caballeronia telluris]|uniref:hypothetical protein n=1 Tax=Caballeronia telluris TaxID=326475 RepID=UPI001357C6C5|nr:hypothetical protein [Caballeronia telluris]